MSLFSHMQKADFLMTQLIGKPVFSVLTRSATDLAVQPQKMTKGLKIRIKEVNRVYYLCRENKGTDQQYGYHAVYLHL